MAQGHLPLRTRSFATEAAASEAPKKAPAKNTRAKTTGRKVKAKPKKKVKAKPKPKPKPKKKVLTLAQKALLQKRREKADLAALKEQALVLPFMKAASAYTIYLKQQLPEVDGSSPADKVRKIGESWKYVSKSDLEVSPPQRRDAP
jgi:outer membrane biosynthesis protein TonB